MSEEDSKKWLAELASKPVAPTVEIELILDRVVEYYSAMEGFKHMSGLSIPAVSGDRKSLTLYQFGMLMGKFVAMMSLFVDTTGETPPSKLWDEAALRVATRVAKNGE